MWYASDEAVRMGSGEVENLSIFAVIVPIENCLEKV